MEKMLRHLSTKKIKYSLLAPAFDGYGIEYIGLLQERGVTVYLDSRVLFKTAYQFRHIDGDIMDECFETIFASAILSTTGHYRNFFAKVGIETNFVVMFETEIDKAIRAFDPEYKLDSYTKHLSAEEPIEKLIRTNIDIARRIIDNGIPGMTTVDNSLCEYEFLPLFIHQFEIYKQSMGLLITDSKLMLTSMLYDRMIGLVPNHDNFKLLNSGNLIKFFCKKLDERPFPQNLIRHYLVLNGVHKFFKGVKGYGPAKTINLLGAISGEGEISDEKFYSMAVAIDHKIDTERLYKNLILANPENHYVSFKSTDRIAMESTLRGFHFRNQGMNMVEELNHKIFQNYPLNTKMLFRGFKSKPIDTQEILR